MFKPSPYSLAESGKTQTGQFGAVALVAFKTKIPGKEGLTDIPRGAYIKPEIVMGWPLANRLAMGTSARVRYFLSEAERAEVCESQREIFA